MLGSDWQLWEKYQGGTIQNSTNYQENMGRVYLFGSLPAFATFWKHTVYSNPSRLFFDSQENCSRKFTASEIDNEEKTVDGLILFRNGIEPKWEHSENKNGCSFSLEIRDLTAEQIDQIWQNLAVGLVGENFPFSGCVNGVRFLDRLKKLSLIKIELWLSVGSAAHKQSSTEHVRAERICAAIETEFSRILSRTRPTSVHEIITKQHFTANKVN